MKEGISSLFQRMIAAGSSRVLLLLVWMIYICEKRLVD